MFPARIPLPPYRLRTPSTQPLYLVPAHTHTRTHTNRSRPGFLAQKTICETVKLKLLYEINHVGEEISQPHTLCVSAKL